MAASSVSVTTTTGRAHDAVLGVPFAASDGIVYLLTSCCGASATGTEAGVACRACYCPIDDRMGMAWLAADFVAGYPAWCAANGLAEVEPGLFANYAARVATLLGVAA